MIEAEITITCEGCMKTKKIMNGELTEIANFRHMVACYALPELPDGWKHDAFGEIYCDECETKY